MINTQNSSYNNFVNLLGKPDIGTDKNFSENLTEFGYWLIANNVADDFDNNLGRAKAIAVRIVAVVAGIFLSPILLPAYGIAHVVRNRIDHIQDEKQIRGLIEEMDLVQLRKSVFPPSEKDGKAETCIPYIYRKKVSELICNTSDRIKQNKKCETPQMEVHENYSEFKPPPKTIPFNVLEVFEENKIIINRDQKQITLNDPNRLLSEKDKQFIVDILTKGTAKTTDRELVELFLIAAKIPAKKEPHNKELEQDLE